jgi:hypothetical protein
MVRHRCMPPQDRARGIVGACVDLRMGESAGTAMTAVRSSSTHTGKLACVFSVPLLSRLASSQVGKFAYLNSGCDR